VLIGPKPRPLQQHHQRDLVAYSQLGDPVPLGIAARPDSACDSGEVLGTQHDRSAVHLSRTDHYSVRGDLAAGQGAKFTETAAVDEVVDAGACVQLALGMVRSQSILSAHRERSVPPSLQIGESVIPVAGSCHRGSFRR
jgi:hypothetical protein